jgi:hypothetical protein
VTKASFTPAASAEVGEIAAERVLAGVRKRGEARRPPGRAGNSGNVLRVKPRKLALLPAQTDDVRGLAAPGFVGRFGAGWRRAEAGQAAEDVGAPGGKIGRGAHRLAKLAVVRNVDAGLFLFGDDINDGLFQERFQLCLLLGVAAWLRPRLAKRLRPRQAAGVRRQHAIDAPLHSRFLFRTQPTCRRAVLFRKFSGLG